MDQFLKPRSVPQTTDGRTRSQKCGQLFQLEKHRVVPEAIDHSARSPKCDQMHQLQKRRLVPETTDVWAWSQKCGQIHQYEKPRVVPETIDHCPGLQKNAVKWISSRSPDCPGNDGRSDTIAKMRSIASVGKAQEAPEATDHWAQSPKCEQMHQFQNP